MPVSGTGVFRDGRSLYLKGFFGNLSGLARVVTSAPPRRFAGPWRNSGPRPARTRQSPPGKGGRARQVGFQHLHRPGAPVVGQDQQGFLYLPALAVVPLQQDVAHIGDGLRALAQVSVAIRSGGWQNSGRTCSLVVRSTCAAAAPLAPAPAGRTRARHGGGG